MDSSKLEGQIGNWVRFGRQVSAALCVLCSELLRRRSYATADSFTTEDAEGHGERFGGLFGLSWVDLAWPETE